MECRHGGHPNIDNMKRGWVCGAFPALRPLPNRKSRSFLLLEQVVYVTDRLAPYPVKIRINPGLESDLLSIPRVLPMGLHGNSLIGGAIIHDAFYQGINRDWYPALTRKKADQIFLDAMIDNQVVKIQAHTYYGVVRLLGVFSYART